MGKIESKIQKIIEENPGVVIPKEEIKNSFMNNLKSALRSKDLTDIQAVKEINGYLSDLLKASGGSGKFTSLNLEKLRALKVLVNEDYGAVHKIMEMGGTLSPRQKVIAAAWDSLDDAVKSASPEMKALLRDESNLFKAAPSLSAARSNPPTLRFMGSSIPASVTEKGSSVLTDILRKGGEVTGGVGEMGQKLDSNLLQTILGQAPTRLQQIGQNGQQVPSEEQNYNAPDNLNQGISPNRIISQPLAGTPTGLEQTQTNGMPSKEKFQQAMLLDMAQGGKNITKLKTIMDMIYPESSTKMSSATQTAVNLAKSGIRGLKEAQTILDSDPNVLLKQVVPGKWASRKYDSAMFRAVEALLRARSGAAVPETEVRRYMERFAPNIGDNAETIKFKMAQFNQDFNDVLDLAGTNNDDPLSQAMQLLQQ